VIPEIFPLFNISVVSPFQNGLQLPHIHFYLCDILQTFLPHASVQPTGGSYKGPDLLKQMGTTGMLCFAKNSQMQGTTGHRALSMCISQVLDAISKEVNLKATT
jgi:hypothetical protein